MYSQAKKKIPEISNSGIQHLRKHTEAIVEKCAAVIVNKRINYRNENLPIPSCFLRLKTEIVNVYHKCKTLSVVTERVAEKQQIRHTRKDAKREYSQSIRYAGFVQVQKRHINV